MTEPDGALVEAVARAIHEAGPCDDTDCVNPHDRGYCDKRAEAALRAIRAVLGPVVRESDSFVEPFEMDAFEVDATAVAEVLRARCVRAEDERDRLRAEVEECDGAMALVDSQGALLTDTVNALRGDPPPLVHWSHHDVADLARGMRQRAEAAEAEEARIRTWLSWWLTTALDGGRSGPVDDGALLDLRDWVDTWCVGEPPHPNGRAGEGTEV